MRKRGHLGTLIRQGFVILWATAIFWFYLGNLINFHQNRIWGKVLIPACFTHSSINNKDFGSFQDAGHESIISFSGFDFEGTNDIDFPVLSSVNYFSQLFQYDFNEATEYNLVVSGFSLRGPPAV